MIFKDVNIFQILCTYTDNFLPILATRIKRAFECAREKGNVEVDNFFGALRAQNAIIVHLY